MTMRIYDVTISPALRLRVTPNGVGWTADVRIKTHADVIREIGVERQRLLARAQELDDLRERVLKQALRR